MEEKAMKRGQLILEGNLLRAVLILAIPAAINDFIRAAYQLIDTIFVSNIGSMEIAAIAFVGPINMLVRTMSMGFSVAATNLIAREIGQGSYKKAKSAAIQVFSLALLIGLLISVFSLLYSEEVLKAASASDAIFDISNLCFRLTALSSPLVFINSIYVSVKRAEGDTYKAMKVNMGGMIVKIIMTYFMVIHLGMGIAGLAVSTIIGTLAVSFYAVYDLFIKESILQLSFRELRFQKHFLLTLMLIAIPVIIEKSSISFGFIVLNKYVISYGEKVLAGYGVTNRINSMFFATVSGFATGLAPIVSQNLGAGQTKRARKAIYYTLVIAVLMASVIICIVLPMREYLGAYFAKGDGELLYHIVNAMGVYSISVIPWAVFQVANGVFSGTGHTKFSMVLSILRIYAFRLPVVILLSTYTSLNEFSIWYGMLIANVLTGICAIIFYFVSTKELKLIAIRN